jgi:sugar PTS system EIIA component
MPAALIVRAPITGRAVPLGEVPDPVFAAQMVGSGVAVEPPSGKTFEVVSPITGTIIKLLPHAFIVVDGEGRGVLIHVGIDTVKLKGEGFELLAEKGAAVEAGALVMRVDPTAATAAGYSLVSPVVVLDTKPDTATPLATGAVEAGAELFSVP